MMHDPRTNEDMRAMYGEPATGTLVFQPMADDALVVAAEDVPRHTGDRCHCGGPINTYRTRGATEWRNCDWCGTASRR